MSLKNNPKNPREIPAVKYRSVSELPPLEEACDSKQAPPPTLDSEHFLLLGGLVLNSNRCCLPCN